MILTNMYSLSRAKPPVTTFVTVPITSKKNPCLSNQKVYTYSAACYDAEFLRLFARKCKELSGDCKGLL